MGFATTSWIKWQNDTVMQELTLTRFHARKHGDAGLILTLEPRPHLNTWMVSLVSGPRQLYYLPKAE